MRLWSIHPSYLDRAGLTACWREGLLARKVLSGGTVGYRKHPQLIRFRECGDPLCAIDQYLHYICDEADRRGYNFDRSKLGPRTGMPPIPVTSGQLDYEWRHLQQKIISRSPQFHERFLKKQKAAAHPIFCLRNGPVELWEKVKEDN